MATAVLARMDLSLRDAVLQQLAWDSQLDASRVNVTAKHGTVTLSGFIESYAAKLAAERAARRVRGVRAVANHLQVHPHGFDDTEIADDARRALRLRVGVPDTVQAIVRVGYVTLVGSVFTLFQRAVAEKALTGVRGVRGVVNRITVAPAASNEDVKPDLVRALHRDAELDACGIQVHVSGGVVTLTGRVNSWREREAAERTAMHARGITRVDNWIVVLWPDEVAADDAADEAC